jgi:hypothetical protein
MAQQREGTVVIVYESMFGSTRQIAESIAAGFRPAYDVDVVPVREAKNLPDDLALLIVGAPTHVHGLSHPESRADAVRWAADERKDLTLEPGFDVLGVRDWLEDYDPRVARHVAFDTRVDMPRIFTGSAAGAIDRRLTATGSQRVAHPMSFFVDRDSHLEPGEVDRARRWGAQLVDDLAPTPVG